MLNSQKHILISVFNPIQFDARVIRSAEALNEIGKNVVVISYNSDLNYRNSHFVSIVFNGKVNKFSLLFFSYNLLLYSIKNRKNIKLLYLHDYYLCGIGHLISRLTKIKWVYDAHELLIERKNTKRNFRSRFFLYIEKISIKKADLVIAANYERERIIKYVYKLKNTINVLNIASYKDFNLNFDLKKDNILVYQGYLSKGRGIEDYINLLLFLPDNYKLKIIGGGPDSNFFKEKVAELLLTERVKFVGVVPYSQLINENKNCKVGIVSYSLNGLNNYYCSPNKLYEYAQLNMPMIFSSQPFLQKVSNKYRIGEVFYENMDFDEKSRLVMKVFDNINYYQTNMSTFLSDFSHDREMNKLKTAVNSLLTDT